MATVTGASGVFKAVATGGSVVVVGEVRSYSYDGSADAIEDTVMGDTARTYKAGLAQYSLSVEAYFDSTDSGQDALVEGATIDWELHPEGTGTGTPVYSGSGVVTASAFTATFDGMAEASFSIQGSGERTASTN
jgi:hypothetical protein